MGRRDLIVYGLFAVVVVFLLGGLVAIIGMGQFRTDLNLAKMPQYFWFYRHNPFVMGWLAKGVGGVAAAGGLIAAMIYINRKDALHGAARWARHSEAKAAGLMDREGLLLGKSGNGFVQFGGTEHVLLEAPTRAGKGVGVVIPNLLTWADSVVVLDVKQENWEKSAGWRKSLGHQVLLFDPLDPQGRTCRFNPFSHINRSDPVEVIDELQKIAAMLWPPPANGESFWMDSARTAFIGVAAYIAATPVLPFTMGEVYRNFSAGDAKERFPKIIKERQAQRNPLSEACISALNDWISSSANTFTGIRQSVSAKINLWINPYVDAATSESDFDLREFRSRADLALPRRLARQYRAGFGHLQSAVSAAHRPERARAARREGGEASNQAPPVAGRICAPLPRQRDRGGILLCRWLRHPAATRHPGAGAVAGRIWSGRYQRDCPELRRRAGIHAQAYRRSQGDFRTPRQLHLSG